MAIIGVVAALTIPTLIVNYQSKAYISQRNKMQSTLANAYKKMMADNLVFETANLPIMGCKQDEACINSEYSKVLKIADSSLNASFENNYCNKSYNVGDDKTVDTFCGDYTAILSDGSLFTHENTADTGIKDVNMSDMMGYSTMQRILNAIFGAPAYALSIGGGSSLSGAGGDSSGLTSAIVIAIDVNGSKEPNTIGKDLYILNLNTKGAFLDVTTFCTNHTASEMETYSKSRIVASAGSDSAGLNLQEQAVCGHFESITDSDSDIRDGAIEL